MCGREWVVVESAVTWVGEEVCEPPAAEDAVCYATVAQHEDGSEEEENAEQAWSSLQQEGQQVEEDDQHLFLHNVGAVRRGHKQHRQHPVQAVHGAAVVGGACPQCHNS